VRVTEIAARRTIIGVCGDPVVPVHINGRGGSPACGGKDGVPDGAGGDLGLTGLAGRVAMMRRSVLALEARLRSGTDPGLPLYEAAALLDAYDAELLRRLRDLEPGSGTARAAGHRRSPRSPSTGGTA
jgi:hypothetical protein